MTSDEYPDMKWGYSTQIFRTMFDLVYASGVRHIAIELGPDDKEERIPNNMHRSIEYLENTGIIRFE